MKINFLTGDLALRYYKTGVHVVHEKLLEYTASDNYMGQNVVISCYRSFQQLEQEYQEYCSEKYKDKLIFSNKLVRFLLYMFPIEIFFGKSDMYICDGIVPITLKKSKKIAIIHDLMVYLYPENYGILKKMYLKLYYYKCKKVDKVIAISESTKNDIIKFLGIPSDRIEIMPLGNVDEKREFDSTSMSMIDFTRKYFLYIGDMRKNKNLLNAIKGFEKSSEKFEDIYFYIAGAKKNEYENLKKYVEEHNLQEKVIFCGYVSEYEKYMLYKNSIGLLFVSKYEGFGIPILEAVNYDIPVITSNVSSMKEIGEGYCKVVNPDNIYEIHKAIEYLLKDDNREKIINRQQELKKIYTWEKTYAQFKHILLSEFDKNEVID